MYDSVFNLNAFLSLEVVLNSATLLYRYELVPKVVKEDEFWRNYFYRLNLVKQSFDLKDLVSSLALNPEANCCSLNNAY